MYSSASPGGHCVTENTWNRSFDITPRNVGRMMARNRDVFLKTWKVNLLPPIAEPVLYLLALGYGLGALITEVDGISYVRYIAPSLIAITMMQSAFFETTYSSFVRLSFQKTWDAVVVTPLTVEDIITAEILWAAVRAVIYSTIMAIVVAGFGLLSFPGALLIPLVAFLVGLVFAGMGMIFTSKVPNIDSFSYVFYLFVTPQFLFSGTFFPLAQLPDGVRHAALLLPLTPAVQLVRGIALGRPTGYETYAIVYLSVLAVFFLAVAVLQMKKRLVK